MSLRLTIRNRQRTRAVDVALLRTVANALLAELIQVQAAELGILLVTAPEMTRVNETYLQHAGATDVITFDYSELGTPNTVLSRRLHGEIFICVDEAIRQARSFHTTWQTELVRYITHGVLHLLGHDDHLAADRRKMKREENRLVRKLGERFALSRLARKPKLRP